MQDPDRAIYDATVSYHNTLVQTRFSVAALFMTAAAFLVAAHLGETKWLGHRILIPLLGSFITAATWAVELRTRALLANLCEYGRRLEDTMSLALGFGFFSVMHVQPVGPKIPFTNRELPSAHPLVRYVVSHGFCLNALYLSFFLFWLNAIWIATR